MKTNDMLIFLKIERKSNDLHNEYKRIAKILFEEFVLVKDGITKYFLTEIEFYLLALWHQDYYIYGHSDQKKFGEWYRHASGVDLTFGDPNENIFAGILIRGLRETDGKQPFINGSINVLNALSDKNSKVTSEELQQKVALWRVPKSKDKEIFISTRVGLTTKSFEEHKKRIKSESVTFQNQKQDDPLLFLQRHYRFITAICPENQFRFKTTTAEITRKNCNYSPDDINKLYGWKVIKG
jgi:hypothetical protein